MQEFTKKQDKESSSGGNMGSEVMKGSLCLHDAGMLTDQSHHFCDIHYGITFPSTKMSGRSQDSEGDLMNLKQIVDKLSFIAIML